MSKRPLIRRKSKKPPSKARGWRLDADIATRIEEIAVEHEVSQNSALNDLVRLGLEVYDRERARAVRARKLAKPPDHE